MISGGNVVNQVQREFNGLGQMTKEWQSHSGVVNTGTTSKVQYAYSEMSGGANHSRLTSVTYPSGYVLTYNYSSGLNSSISRLSSLSDTSGTVESYDYLGFGIVVRRAHPQPNVDLSYVKRTGESNGAAGDQYTGLDLFGRVIDQRWLNPTTGTATDRFQYGYDLMGNRLYRDNLVNTAFGELYAYDSLNQLSSFDRGTLNGTKTGLTGSASRAQDWDYDALGNWDSLVTDGSTQTRSANKQNEITSISGATTPTYDANGNMTTDETGKQLVFDAWNRLKEVKSSGGVSLKTYGYDGLSRRVTETASGTTTDLYYSDAWQVLEEKVGANTTKRYVWSPVYVDAMVLRDRDTDGNGTLDERLWVQQDANFNVTALVNASGTVVERYAYDPFGVRTVYDASYNVRSGGSAYDFQHGFQGMAFDPVSGLNVSRGRPGYSPSLGRWNAVDPSGLEPDVNPYRFVGNIPVNLVDPTGLEGVPPRGWGSYRGSATGKPTLFKLDRSENVREKEASWFATLMDPNNSKNKRDALASQFKVIKTADDFLAFWKESGKKNLKYVVKKDGTLILINPKKDWGAAVNNHGNKIGVVEPDHSMATAFPLNNDGGVGEYGADIRAAGWVQYNENTKALDIDIETGHYGLARLNLDMRRTAACQAFNAELGGPFEKLPGQDRVFSMFTIHPENKKYKDK